MLQGDHSIDEAHLFCLKGVVLAAEEPDLSGALLADRPRKQACAVSAIERAHFWPGLSKARVVGSDSEVADQMKNLSSADGVAGHHRDHRFRKTANLDLQIEHVEPAYAVLADVSVVTPNSLVATRAEGEMTLAGEDHDSDLWVVARPLEGVREFKEGLWAKGISNLWSTNRYLRDSLCCLVADVLVSEVVGDPGGAGPDWVSCLFHRCYHANSTSAASLSSVSRHSEGQLVAVVERGPAAARLVRAVWDAGAAVCVLDPDLPPRRLRELIEALSPHWVADRRGTTPMRSPRELPPGTRAVVATSGSTARPKLVCLSEASMVASARAVTSVVGAESGDRWLVCLPLHYVAALAILARAEVTGASLEVHDGFDPEAVAQAASRCQLVSVVATMLRRLVARRAPLRRFRTILAGGGSIPSDLVATAKDAGANVVVTYGMTETNGGCFHDGHPLPGVGVRISKEGEILISGPVLMEGYLGDPELTRRTIDANGWLHTGDLGSIRDGVLQVSGRLSGLISTGGVKVAPALVEEVLIRHPGVSDVAVLGVPDPEWGERVVAFVVPTERSNPPTLEEIRRAGSGRLSPAELPKQVVVVDFIPRDERGKLKAELRQALVEQAMSN